MKLYDNLLLKTKDDLNVIAGKLKIKNRSKMKKAELAEAITQVLITDECMTDILFKLSDEELTLIEKNVCDCERTDDIYSLRDIVFYGYAVENDGKSELCDEFAEVFLRCSTESFRQEKCKRDNVCMYCYGLSMLYGIISIDKLFEIYDKQNHDMTVDEFKKILWQIDDDDNLWTVYDGNVVDTYVLENDLYTDLLTAQMGKPFYVMSKKKLTKVTNSCYIEHNNELEALIGFLKRDLCLDEVNAENMAYEIQYLCSEFGEYVDFETICKTYNAKPNKAQMNRLIDLVQKLDYKTRKAENRGHTDEEIDEILNSSDDFEDFFVPMV